MSPVHVIGLAARSPVGVTMEASAAAVRGRIGRVRRHPFLVDLRGEPVRIALDAELPSDLFGRERMLRLATSTLEETVQKVAPSSGTEILVFLGLPELRPGWSESDANWLAGELGKSRACKEASLRISPVVGGHAAALQGLHEVVTRIAKADRGLAIVGGVDSYLHPDTLSELDGREQLDADDVWTGFAPGEAAGFMVVCGAQSIPPGQTPLATIRGTGIATDQKLDGADEVNLGEGLAEAIRRASSVLRPGERIDEVYYDLNGERFRTEEWGLPYLGCRRSSKIRPHVGPALRNGATSGQRRAHSL